MEPVETTKHHVYTHPSPVEHWRHAAEIVALVIAAVWGLYVFVYQERIKPAGEAPAMDLRPSVSTQPLPGGRRLVTVSLHEKNIGSVDLQLVATAVNVYGFKYGLTMHPRSRVNAPAGQYGYGNSLPRSKSVLLSSVVTLDRPAGVSPAIWSGFSPGNEKAFATTFAVPAHDFDALTVGITVCYTRLDDQRVVAVTPRRTNDGGWDTAALAATLHRVFSCRYTNRDNGIIFAL